MKEITKTIFALATAPMTAALAVIRISGPEAKKALQILSGRDEIAVRSPFLATLCYQGEVIDQVTAVYFAAPRSFTGEEMVEITTHGSLLVIARLTAALLGLGLREAARGEFSLQAFCNGKIDLVQAEAINDLIMAQNPIANKIALNNLGGKVSNHLKEAETEIAQIAASLVVAIDYPEYYDVENLEWTELVSRLKAIRDDLQALAERSQFGMVASQGVKVAIVGKPNVGKSTLLNALLGHDKAITSATPGTTRDVVEGEKLIGGINFRFYDTAGVRRSAKAIEKIGISKTYQTIAEADLVLVVLDSDDLNEGDRQLLTETANRKRLIIRNKADLGHAGNTDYLALSAIRKDVTHLEQALIGMVQAANYNWRGDDFLVNARQIGQLQSAITYLETSLTALAGQLPPDLIIIDIDAARRALGFVIGREVITDIEEEVFARFCVGK